jgi:hypothetical protein
MKSVDDPRRTEDGEQTLMSSSSGRLGKAVTRSSKKGPEGQNLAKLNQAQELPKAQQRPKTRSGSLFRIEHGLRVQDVPDAEFVSVRSLRSYQNSVEDLRVPEESEGAPPGAESHLQEADREDTSAKGKKSRPLCGCTIS